MRSVAKSPRTTPSGAAWLQPTTIMPARFAKLSLQFDF
jgi:hypothetical protein